MKTEQKNGLRIKEIQSKMEYYCSYQDRCHKEVLQKMRDFFLIEEAQNQILMHLIEHNFINEERFARSFVRGKHHYKKWGKVRITIELKQRDISTKLIQMALTEISEREYLNTFFTLAEKHWEAITETNMYKKKQKWLGFMMRRGYESNLIYEALSNFE